MESKDKHDDQPEGEKPEGFFRSIFKDSEDFASTLAVLLIFVGFLLVIGASVSQILIKSKLDPQMILLVEHLKELAQMILTYLFTKSQVAKKQ